MGSIRARLLFLVGGVAMLTVLAAAGIFFAVQVSDRALERLMASQHRLDLLAEISGRLTDYALASIDSTNATSPSRTRLADLRAQTEEALVAFDAAQGQADPGAGGGRVSAHLRADFRTLDASVGRALDEPGTLSRGDAIRGALNVFALSAGPALSSLVEAERRAVAAGRDSLRQTSRRLVEGALAAALLALVAAVLLHRRITLPLLQRIVSIEHAAKAVARGDLETRLPIGARDELGLVVARFNRMASMLAQRERRLSEDRANLERTVAERTADLTKANEQLGAIDRSRRRFFADVSHELRTPLTVVLGECDVALRATSIPAETVRPILTTIRQRALRLHRRVEDLLRVARSESGEIDLDFRQAALQSVLSDAVESFAISARRQGLELRLDLPDTPVEARADAEWLRQVVEGLIDNAIRHATGATAIVVSLSAGAAGASITVADDGCGIPPEAREQVFQRFARRNSAEKSGFGIGLALARWIIARHDGSILISSDEDSRRGTRVTIVLPTAASGN
ncbi:sensor histidine kinase [Oleomonas cavernae]|uniref:histidine kinase n=1 Tax=Oleomonas cavernae TaxID=2320859 RepID=A0A418VTU5_9PROT|nr:HAMP domain-containing sensor histidine kinase [Oleomonas cavernae]RJF80575.1 sensor histidine kinase [Oleomonas cavernae]